MKLKLLFIVFIFSSFVSLAQNFNEHGGIYGFSENLVYVVTDNGHFFKSEDGGFSWVEYSSGVNVEFYDLNFYNESLGFAVGQEGKILKTTDAGNNWTEVASGITNDLYSIGIGALNNIYVVGDAGIILQSTDGGENWNSIQGVSSERLNHINFKNENTAYIAGDNGTLLYTENGGIDWQTLNAGTTDNYYYASVTENSVQILSGPEREYYFREGINGLQSFDNVNWNMYSMQVSIEPISGFHFQNDSEGYAVTSADALCQCCYIEIVKTIDGGTNWESIFFQEFGQGQCNGGIGFSDISFVNDDHGYVLIGDKILIITPDEIFTSMIFLETADFEKKQNFVLYPNPTENTITIQLNNPTIENLNISIFDITGKPLLSHEMNNSRKELDISALSNGIYFISLKSNGKSLGYQKLVKK